MNMYELVKLLLEKNRRDIETLKEMEKMIQDLRRKNMLLEAMIEADRK